MLFLLSVLLVGLGQGLCGSPWSWSWSGKLAFVAASVWEHQMNSTCKSRGSNNGMPQSSLRGFQESVMPKRVQDRRSLKSKVSRLQRRSCASVSRVVYSCRSLIGGGEGNKKGAERACNSDNEQCPFLWSFKARPGLSLLIVLRSGRLAKSAVYRTMFTRASESRDSRAFSTPQKPSVSRYAALLRLVKRRS